MCLGVNLVLILDIFFLKYLINVFFYDFNIVMLKINIFLKSYFNLISSKKTILKSTKKHSLEETFSAGFDIEVVKIQNSPPT